MHSSDLFTGMRMGETTFGLMDSNGVMQKRARTRKTRPTMCCVDQSQAVPEKCIVSLHTSHWILSWGVVDEVFSSPTND